MFLQEHIVITISGIQCCHDSQTQESKATKGTVTPGEISRTARIG